jgi:hypothetical protein
VNRQSELVVNLPHAGYGRIATEKAVFEGRENFPQAARRAGESGFTHRQR